MSGLYLLLVAAVWLGLSAMLASWVTSRIKRGPLRLVALLVVVGLVLPLPLVDELVGKRQFEQLCRDNATIQVDPAKASGKTVYFAPQPNVEVQGTWVRIVIRPQVFVDAETGEPVVSYNELIAAGGRLAHALGVSESKVPLTFSQACGPTESPRDLFKSLRINAQDRPK